MRFFYRLERFEGGEYVVVEVEEDGFSGVGAILPERSKGENYKTIMGAIEEYRYIVERSRIENYAIISQRLLKHFPNHPKVTFAISSAMFELFAKLNDMSVLELLMVEDLDPPEIVDDDECVEVIRPEDQGGVVEAIKESDWADCVEIRGYPMGEMERVFEAISRYFHKKISREG